MARSNGVTTRCRSSVLSEASGELKKDKKLDQMTWAWASGLSLCVSRVAPWVGRFRLPVYAAGEASMLHLQWCKAVLLRLFLQLELEKREWSQQSWRKWVGGRETRRDFGGWSPFRSHSPPYCIAAALRTQCNMPNVQIIGHLVMNQMMDFCE